ncbi:ectoine/hydroxyectoine ABC transporter substrate-binding protein EhuB [Pelagibacterium xiamenense]|uniref:ectoine/hydroxyectoine ABC transporter substrate-binding protein EhuB n=1 Tax=Pelagibacterium xiamenense TaxID=2901140 RepID=UPI001E30767C|nr:ectoine/hydroxyectoine ABC transporter substrate-binding protein EhuB [Pelagibacterium xiamenense]MCD7059379.1 ectoine/hydroxyectoine ABC transporter substrate-binding protein EhuB [Pelagibacterium xiamenense]
MHGKTTHTLRNTLLAGAALGALALTGAAQAASLEEIQESGTIRIAVANEIPYGYIDPNGEAMGAGPDVAKHVMAELGVENIEWITTEFSSLIPGLQADRFDMVAAEMAILPQRCEQVIYSSPTTSYGEGLLVAEGNPAGVHAYSDFADNPDLTVAIMAGADQLEMLQALGVPEGQMVTINSNADAISTVSTGRADAYAATGLTVGELANRSDAVEAATDFVDPVIDGTEIRSWGGFTFAQGSESLRDAVNGVLAEYQQTEEWSSGLASYGFTEADINGVFNATTEELCSESAI